MSGARSCKSIYEVVQYCSPVVIDDADNKLKTGSIWNTYRIESSYAGGYNMSLIKCETCGKEISANALACPHCGEETPLAKAQKAKKKKIIICVVIAALCINTAVLFLLIGMPKIREYKENKKLGNKYDEARQLASAGEFERAREIFLSLGEFKDSGEQVKLCDEGIINAQYERGLQLQSEGKYEEAACVFESLGDYKDSKKRIEDCWMEIEETKYQEARELYSNQQYDEALELFKKLGGYKDSSEMVVKSLSCKFNEGDIIKFGTYEQDGNVSDGSEPIEWIVLTRQDNKVLLLSRQILDWRPFHNQKNIRDVTWATCSLREWLNGSFYLSTFSSREQEFILKTSVDASMNQYYKETPQGKDTVDKVFLLSAYQASLHSKAIKSAGSSTDIELKRIFNNAKKTSDIPLEISDYTATLGWWTRTMGRGQAYVSYVTDKTVEYTGQYYWWSNMDYPEYKGIRPAIWINVEYFLDIEE